MVSESKKTEVSVDDVMCAAAAAAAEAAEAAVVAPYVGINFWFITQNGWLINSLINVFMIFFGKISENDGRNLHICSNIQ